ncbi:SDR family oxidoreductase [Belnapia sp. T6]|uniref:SDR family oxidoreductase n=1 Tax=Belnapia mucosa TaxID=2804532 RepID=A0ABS1UX75_9PROT|nr:SDR family NAD(P)-dependent oxidoreductase [Belnapia mucosa]MBL6454060.1 SDR family oxidoreductase [Belnapia mucosa]
MTASQRLQGKVAIVTGAGSCGPGWGNGRATAVLFAREGATVILVDLDRQAAAETAALIEGEGNRCEVAALDVLDLDATVALAEHCDKTYGRIDILHCNVGRGSPGGPLELSVEQFRRDLDMNLTSAFIGCKAVLPVMIRQGTGVITTVGSIGGLRHLGHDHVGYSAGKAGLVQFTRQIAGQYGRHGIRANTIIPGMMDTPLMAVRVAKQGHRGDMAALHEEARRRVPLGRRGTGWDVAHAALYLASDEAAYITGTELLIDGGFMVQTA